MRQTFSRAVPNVTLLAGQAEELPLPDDSVEAIVAGQAWHWFDGRRALLEADRVLSADGTGIGLLWNEHNLDCEWLQEYNRIREEASKLAGDRPTRHYDETWRKAFQETEGWTELQERRFSHEVRMTYEAFVDRAFTTSVFVVLPESERRKLGDEIMEMLRRSNGSDNNELVVPHVTEVYWSLRQTR